MRQVHTHARTHALAAAFALAACALCPAPARAQGAPPPPAPVELLTNGGFEAGDLRGWGVASRPLGDPYDPATPARGGFYAVGADAAGSPASGLSVLAPQAGSFFALSDGTARGAHALYQSFTVPTAAVGAVSLSFSLYVYDWYGAGAAVDPSGLDHTSGGTGAPNQHARVDLLSASAGAGAGALDTSPSSVLATFYAPGVDPEAAAGAAPVWRPYSFDLTAAVLPGETYTLRFGAVDNQFVLHQAVDSVSVLARVPAAAAVPEPGSLALAGAGALAVAAGRRRRQRRGQ